jgi:hypothetical protein
MEDQPKLNVNLEISPTQAKPTELPVDAVHPINRLFIWFFILLWTISLALPGVIKNGGSQISEPGFIFLMIGWGGLIQGIFSWYANPLAFIAVRALFSNNFQKAVVCSLLSIPLALQALLFQGEQIGYIDSTGPFGVLSYGYYLWVLSLVYLSVLCLVGFVKNQPKSKDTF